MQSTIFTYETTSWSSASWRRVKERYSSMTSVPWAEHISPVWCNWLCSPYFFFWFFPPLHSTFVCIPRAQGQRVVTRCTDSGPWHLSTGSSMGRLNNKADVNDRIKLWLPGLKMQENKLPIKKIYLCCLFTIYGSIWLTGEMYKSMEATLYHIQANRASRYKKTS